MANDGSVAPKERVNIVYKSDVGGAEEEVELPFRILVAGDFTGRGDDTPIEQRQLVNVNKTNFDQVLEGKDVRVALTTRDVLSNESDAELQVELEFKRMRDFEPDSIVQQVPELRTLVELRDALTVLKGPLGNVPAFRRRLQALIGDTDAKQALLKELDLPSKTPGAE